jgi:ADYC domain
VRLHGLSLSLVLALGWGGGSVPAEAGTLTVQGTEFVLDSHEGRVLRGEQLVGTILTLRVGERRVPIHLGAAEKVAVPGGEVVLYRLSALDPDSGKTYSLCKADAKGREAGFPVPDGAGGFSITCTSGAEAKCILMGYRPWEVRGDGVPMRQLHQACVHLIRADYGGDNRPATRDGTMIDIYDRFGIQSPSDTSMTFEAAWGVDGAVCVAHPRFEDTITLSDIAERYPRLRNALGSNACNDRIAPTYPGALVFNRSQARQGASR